MKSGKLYFTLIQMSSQLGAYKEHSFVECKEEILDALTQSSFVCLSVIHDSIGKAIP